MHGTVPYNIFFLIYLNNVEYHLFFNRNPSAYRKRRKMRRRRIPMSNQMNQFLVTRFNFHSVAAFLHLLPIVPPNPNRNLSYLKAAIVWVTPTVSSQWNSLAMEDSWCLVAETNLFDCGPSVKAPKKGTRPSKAIT